MKKRNNIKARIGQWGINKLLHQHTPGKQQAVSELEKWLARIAARLFVKNSYTGRPLLATIALTHKCHLDCSHCSRGKRGHTADFSTKEIIDILHWLQSKSCPIINLTGGEPMLRKDIREIIASVDKRSSLQLYTSGIHIDKNFGDFIKEQGNVFPFISVLSHQADDHDRMKGKKGAYAQALDAIKTLKENGNWAAAAVIASQSSVTNGSFDKLLRFLKRTKVDQVLIFDYKATGLSLDNGEEILHGEALNKAKSYHNIHLRDDNYPNVFSLPYVEGGSKLGCTAGYCRMYIDASGHVCPCDFLPLSFGNVRDEAIEKIWQRMNKSFDKPYKTCFVNNYHREISAQAEGRLPLMRRGSEQLCKNHPPLSHAPVYETLNFNLDLETLINKGFI